LRESASGLFSQVRCQPKGEVRKVGFRLTGSFVGFPVRKSICPETDAVTDHSGQSRYVPAPWVAGQGRLFSNRLDKLACIRPSIDWASFLLPHYGYESVGLLPDASGRALGASRPGG
jgi:hypothetical protein